MTSLSALVNKAPIVSTYASQALRVEAAEVRKAYEWHAATYVEPSVLAELRRLFIEAVQQAKTPKACLVAPFGYGKTASAIGIWHACQRANLLVVPPISCESFTQLARALYDWLMFVLPEQAEKITAAHDKFLAQSAGSLARRDERHFGIPFEQGMAAIKDKLERGYLDFEDVSVNLIAFIQEATILAQETGYDGLVVVIDEFQQLLGNASKGVLVALRQLIWGLRTRQIAFGLLITMDPDTERTLADRAGDILHRIKDDGMYLDIRHIYDREFPERLWKQYGIALDLPDDAQKAIDQPALQALGQLCERDDLSNGPRTVINVLQSVAARAEAGEPSYTPLDLIGDLLSGTIRFDGDRGLIPALVGELLSFPYFQRSSERTKLLKLIAAFPRGCSKETAQTYGLLETWEEVGEDLRGEIITELDEGLALIELQRVGRPANQLNVILRRYWMQITDQQLLAEEAPRVFAELVLPLLFPKKVNDLSGWHPVREVQLKVTGDYTGMLEGTSSQSYPLRRIAVSVVAGEAPVSSETNDEAGKHAPSEINDSDFRFIFRLDPSHDAQSTIRIAATGVFEFKLAINRRSKAGLLGGLAWIEHYLSPQPISPAVVLSLLRYLKQATTDKASERDQRRLGDTLQRLEKWLLAELFPAELFMSAGYPVLSAGSGGLKEFLYLVSRHRWPTYQTLVIYQHWSKNLKDYLVALEQVSPSQRIGIAPVTNSKTQVAKLFGFNRHAGFESRAKQYGALLKLENWRAKEATILFIPHPAETEMANQVRQAGTLPKREIYNRLRSTGISKAEANLLLDFACVRGMVTLEGDTLTVPDLPTTAELVARAKSLQKRGQSLANLPDEVRETLNSIIAEAHEQDEPYSLSRLTPIRSNWELDEIEKWMTKAEAEAEAKAKAKKKAARAKLLKALPQLNVTLSEVSENDLTYHLRAVRKRFTEKQQKLTDQAQELLNNSQHEEREVDALIVDISAWSEQHTLFERWNSCAQRLAKLQKAIDGRAKSDIGEASTIKTLNQKVIALVGEARAILAQEGIPAMGEISRLEISLSELEQQFKSLERQQKKTFVTRNSVVGSYLAKHLENLPPGPSDLSTLLDSTDGSVSQTDLLTELLRLQKEGVIRLTVEVRNKANRKK